MRWEDEIGALWKEAESKQRPPKGGGGRGKEPRTETDGALEMALGLEVRRSPT